MNLKKIIINLYLIIIISIVLTSCGGFSNFKDNLSYRNMPLELNQTKTNNLVDYLRISESNIINLKYTDKNNSVFKAIRMKVKSTYEGEYTDYLYLIKNDVLIYYGYPHEFRRHSNEEIRESAEEVVIQIENEYLNSNN